MAPLELDDFWLVIDDFQLELADFPYDCQALADFHIILLPPPPCIISMGSKHV